METIRFYDVDTGKVVTIPASELAPGAVRAQVHGIDGIVWLLPQKLEPGGVKHSPFDEGVRDYIRKIQAAFAEQRPLSFEEWEDGFRCDANPGPEIALWLHAADVYSGFADGEPSAARRQEVFRCIVTCMNASPDTIWRVFKAEALSRHEAEAVIARFYGKQAEPGVAAGGGGT
jgi:hypothetical protein